MRRAAPEFAACIERLHNEAAAFLKSGLTPPDLPGGYYHDYICPDHGVELRFRPEAPKIHSCPVDGQRFEGDRFDAAWRWFVNHEISEAALKLGVLHRLGERGMVEPLSAILAGYAARYHAYANTPRTGANPGVATYTTLDESVWSVPLAWAFSLVEDALTPSERAHIVSKLFVPAAGHLMRRHYRHVHNFSCWHNAAIATLGRVAGQADLVSFAIDGGHGQRVQLRDGMLPDGLWWEGSMSYHFYALWAAILTALAGRHDSSLDLFADAALRRALRTPVDCAYPDGTLPATHDCWYFTSVTGVACHGVPPAPAFYEIAFSAYGDPAFAAVLHRAYSRSARDSIYALLFGADRIPEADWPSRRSFVLRDSGLAFLRPSGSDLDLMLKFGPDGGHHGHPDKLALAGYAHGWRFSPDLGTPGYGVESLETWYRHTLSHNTVLIDGISQPPTRGELVRWDAGRVPHLVEASAAWVDGAYAGVSMRRKILAHADYFVDVFEVRCASPRRIEWIYHNAGLEESGGEAREAAVLDGSAQYGHLGGVRALRRATPLRIEWKDAAGSLALWLAPDSDEEVLTGESPGHSPSERLGFVLRRRVATETTFVSVFHPYRDGAAVRDVVWDGAGGFDVRLDGRCDRWDLASPQPCAPR